MSIQGQINRIKKNVTDTLSVIESKGVTVPDGSNSDNMAALANSIPQGGAVETVDGVEADETGNVPLGAAKLRNYITEVTDEQLDALSESEKAELYAQGVRILSVQIGDAAETYYSIDADGRHVIVNSGGLNGRATPLVLLQSAWSGEGPHSLTLAVAGVTSDTSACHVVISPAPGSLSEYGECGVYVAAQTEGALLFYAESVPENDLIVNILIVTPNGYTSVVPNPEYGYLRYDEPQALTDEQKSNVITALGLNTEQPEAGVQMELVWENASPNSVFPAQTVALNLNDGEYVDIESAMNAAAETRNVVRCKVGETGGFFHTLIADLLYADSRKFQVTNSGIVFDNVKAYASSTGALSSVSNARAIPTRVWVIKGVS